MEFGRHAVHRGSGKVKHAQDHTLNHVQQTGRFVVLH